MDPVSILPILPVLLIALATMYGAGRVLKVQPQTGRYHSIDGLRGYLAFFVFLHHSVIWYFFLRVHQWSFPPSKVYGNLGPASVAMFFMITAFLFFSKLLEAAGGNMDWKKLYISRVFRIMPLYLFAIGVLFVVVGCLSHWTLKEPITTVARELSGWLAFMVPDINAVPGTRLIMAGVVWSLAFEWLFYCSLPFWGLFLFKIKVPALTLLFAAIMLLLFAFIIIDYYRFEVLGRMSPFLAGMVASFLARNAKLRQIAARKYVSLLVMLLLIIAVIYSSTIYTLVPYLCMALAFTAIACGNTLFGILTHPVSCLLGQISYSIYLLHGMVLFITFHFVLGRPYAAGLPPWGHWLVIAACGGMLVFICSLTYQYIERPYMHAGKAIADKLRALRLRFSMFH